MSAPSILRRIADERADDVARDRSVRTEQALRAQAGAMSAARSVPGFYDALASPGLSLIAEIKRASPSRGRIAGIPEPVDLAHAYAAGGARAISVLTEPRHFMGSLDDLRAVSAAAPVPTLRKDFVVDPYQVLEAAADGAGAVLLIVALHPTPAQLTPLLAAAAELDLDALVEVHDEAELDTALEAGARIVGVNHRDLRTFEIDHARFERLRPRIPAGVVSVAESGIHDAATAARLFDAGADAILVGEHLAAAPDPAAAARALLGRA